MTIDRLPWFPCYPSKLLGALAGMPPDVGYVYTIVLLRTYEVGAPCSDTDSVLARRTGLTEKRVSKSIAWLVDQKKLVQSVSGLSNSFALEVLNDRKQTSKALKENGKLGGEKSAEKRRIKTMNVVKPGSEVSEAEPKPASTILDLDSEVDSKKLVKRAIARHQNRGSRIDPEWKASDADKAFAKQEGFSDFEVQREANKFKDYWTACPGAKGVKLDWAATWRQWIRNAADRAGKRPVSGPRTSDSAGGGFYAKPESPQLEAWDHWGIDNNGRRMPRDRDGGWMVKAEWPPGHGQLSLKTSGEHAR